MNLFILTKNKIRGLTDKQLNDFLIKLDDGKDKSKIGVDLISLLQKEKEKRILDKDILYCGECNWKGHHAEYDKELNIIFCPDCHSTIYK